MFYTIRTQKSLGLCWFIIFLNVVFVSELHQKCLQNNINSIKDKKIQNVIQTLLNQIELINEKKTNIIDFNNIEFLTLLNKYDKKHFPITLKNCSNGFHSEIYYYNFYKSLIKKSNVGFYSVICENDIFTLYEVNIIETEIKDMIVQQSQTINQIYNYLNEKIKQNNFDNMVLLYNNLSKSPLSIKYKTKFQNLYLDSVQVSYKTPRNTNHGIAFIKRKNKWFNINSGLNSLNEGLIFEQKPPLLQNVSVGTGGEKTTLYQKLVFGQSKTLYYVCKC